MVVQILISIEIDPMLTDKQLENLYAVGSNPFVFMGNIVDGRQLIRSQVNPDYIETARAYLISLNKSPVVVGAWDIDGEFLEDYQPDLDEYNTFMDENTHENKACGWLSFMEAYSLTLI